MPVPGAPQDDCLRDLHARTVGWLPAGTRWIDAHTHIGQNDPDGLTSTLDELLEGLARAGHDGAVVFPMHEPDGYAQANRDVRRDAAAAPGGVLRTLTRVDPDAPDALAIAEEGLDAGAVGIKLHPRSDDFALPHPVVDAVAALLAARGGGILLFHAGRGIPALGPSTVAIAERHPEVRIVLAHAGISDVGLLADAAARLPNLAFDTSWWQVDDMLHMYATIPPGQIHYASDMPYGGGIVASLAMVRCARQAGHTREAIAAMAGAQLERVLDGRAPLDLGPATGAVVLDDPRPLGVRLASRRAVAYLGIATLGLFQGGPVLEPLSLARIACATAEEDPTLALVDELCAIGEAQIAAGPAPDPLAPPLPGHAPGVAALFTAGIVAGTPRADAD